MIEPTPENREMVEDFIKSMLLKASLEAKENAYDPELLLKYYSNLTGEVFSFQPGQIIEWKEGCKNKSTPEYGQPVVVIEVLDPPILHTQEDAAYPSFRERLDIVIGVIQAGCISCASSGKITDGLLPFHVDSRRFKPFIRQIPEYDS